MYCIYIITNIENNKVYVGQSKEPVRRWYLHKYNARKNPIGAIQSAINKHGEACFNFDIVRENLSKIEADNLERRLIAIYNTTNWRFGYNRKKGGTANISPSGYNNGMFGKSRPDLAELNKKRKGIPLKKETIEKIKKGGTGLLRGNETKQRISEARKMAWQNGVYATIQIKCKETGVVYDSIREASAVFGKNKYDSSISAHLHGRRKDVKGYTFEKVGVKYSREKKDV